MREGRRRRRLSRSLFVKLFLVVGAAGILVDLSVIGFFKLVFSHQAHLALETNLRRYGRYLAEEIGTPPDTARARALAREQSLHIRYDGPGGPWETLPGLGDLPRERRGWHGPARDIGWSRGRYYVQMERGGARWLFATDFRHAVGARWPYVVALVAALTLILGGALLALRRLLRPIRELNEAVDRLGAGDLAARVPDRCRKDELGELGRAFNAMSGRLQDMVRGREQLLLDVSHELRSPLTRIKVALEMSPEGGAKDSIRDDLAEMDAMIGEILEAARLDSAPGRLSVGAVDLAEVAAEVLKGFAGRAPGADLRAEAGPEGAHALADRERARKVISNVVDNAVKYSGAAREPVEVRVRGGAEEVVITVSDRGPGIPEEEIPRLFEPFYRVDRSRSRETGGYGLGLSLCRRIMMAHGGSIRMEARPGGGATVRLAFPRKGPGGPPVPVPPDGAESPPDGFPR